MQKFRLLLLFIISSTLFSCSADYKIKESIESISLTADSSIKITGETMVFTVKTNNGSDVTNEAIIKVNDAIVDTNTVMSNAVGTYPVQAYYLGVAYER